MPYASYNSCKFFSSLFLSTVFLVLKGLSSKITSFHSSVLVFLLFPFLLTCLLVFPFGVTFCFEYHFQFMIGILNILRFCGYPHNLLFFRWLGYPLILGAQYFVLVESQLNQLILVYDLDIIVLILLLLDLPHRRFVFCLQIYLEQIWHIVVAHLTSWGERIIVDLGVSIEFINIEV